MLNAGCDFKNFYSSNLPCFVLCLICELYFMKHQATKQNNISEKLVDLNISIKYIITYYASSLFTRSREKHGWILASLLPKEQNR